MADYIKSIARVFLGVVTVFICTLNYAYATDYKIEPEACDANESNAFSGIYIKALDGSNENMCNRTPNPCTFTVSGTDVHSFDYDKEGRVLTVKVKGAYNNLVKAWVNGKVGNQWVVQGRNCYITNNVPTYLGNSINYGDVYEGKTRQLSVQKVYDFGGNPTITSGLTWSIRSELEEGDQVGSEWAVINTTTGLVTANMLPSHVTGSSGLRKTYVDVSDSTGDLFNDLKVDVKNDYYALQVTTGGQTVLYESETLQLGLTKLMNSGNKIVDVDSQSSSITWELTHNSSDPNFASIDSGTGILSVGSTDTPVSINVTASFDGLTSSSLPIYVTPYEVSTLDVSIQQNMVVEEATTSDLPITASATWNHGLVEDLAATDLTFVYSSDAFSITADGYIQSNRVGSDVSSNLIVTYANKSSTFVITVNDTKTFLDAVELQGPGSLDENDQAQYRLLGYFDDANVYVVPEWRVVDNTQNQAGETFNATISDDGILTTSGSLFSSRDITVTANLNYKDVDFSDSLLVTVGNADRVVTDMIVDGATQVNEGTSSQFTATATFDDENVAVVTPEWHVDSGAASVDTSGLLTAGTVTSNETVMLVATFSSGGVTKTVEHAVELLNVDRVANELIISGPGQLLEGQVATYQAVVKFDDGTEQIVPEWGLTDGQGVDYSSQFDSVTGVLIAPISFGGLKLELVASYGDFVTTLPIVVFDDGSSLSNFERVSVDNYAIEGDSESGLPAINSDGRFVVFQSFATNFSDDSDDLADVFVYDRATNQIEKVSKSSSGIDSDWHSQFADISGDGRFVVFESGATNLIDGVVDLDNTTIDIFVRDRELGLIEKLSLNANGLESDGSSRNPKISQNGRYVVFESVAEDLDPLDENLVSDVFLFDREKGLLERISGDSHSGAYDPDISADGRVITYRSVEDGVSQIRLYFKDSQASIVASSTNSIIGNDDSSEASVSADGNFVVYTSLATNLDVDSTIASDVFIYSIADQQNELVSSWFGEQGNGDSFSPSVSSDGAIVVFESLATNLFVGDDNDSGDVFVLDRNSSDLTLLSGKGSGIKGNGRSQAVVVSDDGLHVAFSSAANNLALADTNSVNDIMVRSFVDFSLFSQRIWLVASDDVVSPEGSFNVDVYADFTSDTTIGGGLDISYSSEFIQYTDFVFGDELTGDVVFHNAPTSSTGALVGLSFGDYSGVKGPVKVGTFTFSGVAAGVASMNVVANSSSYGDFYSSESYLAQSVNYQGLKISVFDDADDDGMSDAWEALYANELCVDGITYGVDDPLADCDGDGILNVHEFNAAELYGVSLNPASNDSDNDTVLDAVDACPMDRYGSVDTDNDGVCNNADLDDDNDGFNDSWEQYFANQHDSNPSCLIDPLVVNHPLSDYDADGFSLQVEFELQRDPCAIEGAIGKLEYNWHVIPGHAYDRRDVFAKGIAVATSNLANAADAFVVGEFSGQVYFGDNSNLKSTDSKIWSYYSPSIDGFVARYDKNKDLKWVRKIGGIDEKGGLTVRVLGIAVDAMDNAYIVGYADATLDKPVDLNTDVGVDSELWLESSGLFLTKIDVNGNFKWSKVLNGASASGANVAVSLDGTKVFVAGNFGGDLFNDAGQILGDNNYGGQFSFVASYDGEGVYQWAEQLGSRPDGSYAGNQYTKDLSVDAYGNVIVLGSYTSKLRFIDGRDYENDQMYLIKLSSSHVSEWVWSIDGSPAGVSTALDESGYFSSIYLAGNVNSSQQQGQFGASFINTEGTTDNQMVDLPSDHGDDVLLANFSADGSYNWMRSIGGSNNESVTSISAGKYNIFIGGNFNGFQQDSSAILQPYVKEDGYGAFVLSLDIAGEYVNEHAWSTRLQDPNGATTWGGVQNYLMDLSVADGGELYSVGRIYKSNIDFDGDPDISDGNVGRTVDNYYRMFLVNLGASESSSQTFSPVAVEDLGYAVDEGGTLNSDVSVLANDSDADTAIELLSAIKVSDPSNGTLSLSNDGYFVYTHDGSETVGDSFSYKVSDGFHESEIVNVSISISPVNDAPIIDAIPSVVVSENTSKLTVVSAADVDGDAVALSVTGLPAFASFVDNGNRTGSLTLSPGFNDAGEYFITLTAVDNGSPSLNDQRDISVLVENANQQPVAANISISTYMNSFVSGVLSASDADGDSLSYSLITNGVNGTAVITNSATGAFNYTPNDGATGVDNFTYVVNDGQDNSLQATVTVSIDVISDDNDGMPDDWELTYGLDPLDPSDAYTDLDGDGIINLFEHQWGSDPTVDDSGASVSDLKQHWAKIVGGAGSSEEGTQTVVDSQGNVYVTGMYSDAIDFNPNGIADIKPTFGSGDIFVSKYTANGDYLWTKVMGGSGFDSGSGLAVDGADNVYIFGVFNDVVDFDPGTGVVELTATPDSQVFVTKLNSDGNYVWAQQLPGTDQESWGRNLAVDAGGNVYVTALGQDQYATKLYADGSIAWTHNIVTSGAGRDEAHGVVLDASGNVYVSGTLGGETDFLTDPGDGGTTFRNAFLMRLDPVDGSRVWVQALAASSEAEAIEVRGGYVYIGGNFNGEIDFDPGAAVDVSRSGSWRGFVAKYDLDGNYVWSQTLGDYVYGIGVASNDDVYISGDFYGTSLFNSKDKTDSYTAENNEVFITKYLANGDYAWTEALPVTNGSAHVSSLSVSANDEIYLTGGFSGDMDFDPTDVADVRAAQPGGWDMFVLKLAETLPIQAAEDIIWTDLKYVTLTGNTLTAKYNYWQCGAASQQVIPADGAVELVVEPVVNTAVFGLSDVNASASYVTIDYAMMLSGANLYIVENGSTVATDANQTGDVLRVERTGSTIVYKKNGVVFYTSTVPSTGNLIVDVTIGSAGYQIVGAVIYGAVADLDADGLSNVWEEAHGLDPNDPADASLDADADGLTNLQEFENNTDLANADSDADGMSDGWEVQYGLNPNDASDAVLDGDTDGLTNLQEYESNIDPTNWDSDADGMADGWEFQYGLNPNDATDAANDPDGDGIDNLTEYQQGSAPTPPAEDIIWTDLVGMTVTGNTLTAEYNYWQSGAASQQVIPAYGAVELVVEPVVNTAVFGLSDVNASASYVTIDYAMMLSGANLYIVENGSTVATDANQTGDVLRVERTGSTIVYKKNGVVFYTSTVPSTGNLIVDVTIGSAGYQIVGAVIYGAQ